jgi:hypothetical protein
MGRARTHTCRPRGPHRSAAPRRPRPATGPARPCRRGPTHGHRRGEALTGREISQAVRERADDARQHPLGRLFRDDDRLLAAAGRGGSGTARPGAGRVARHSAAWAAARRVAPSTSHGIRDATFASRRRRATRGPRTAGARIAAQITVVGSNDGRSFLARRKQGGDDGDEQHRGAGEDVRAAVHEPLHGHVSGQIRWTPPPRSESEAWRWRTTW